MTDEAETAPQAREEALAATKADAKKRSLRTLLQGAVVVAVLAVAGVVMNGVASWTTGTEVFSAQAWLALGSAAATAVLTAIGSYIMRVLIAPS